MHEPWECPICGSLLGGGLDWCGGLWLDEEDGGDTRHEPIHYLHTVGTDTRLPTIRMWRYCPYVPYLNLPHEAQVEAQRRFFPEGRRDGYENIHNWAFALRKDGRLAQCPYIEPLPSQLRSE